MRRSPWARRATAAPRALTAAAAAPSLGVCAAEIPLFGVLTAKVTFQAYRIAPELDADLFKVPSDYAEGEVKFKGMS